MEHRVITRGDPKYPKKITERLGEEGPERICYWGPLEFLDRFTMSVICANSLGGIGLMETNQVLFTVREYDMNYIGGWYSVMETEIFRLGLYRDNTTVTCMSSKGLNPESYDSFLLDRFYPPMHEFPERDEYFRRAEAGELLMLSIADPDDTRQTRKNIMARNWICCVLGDIVFIPYAERGDKTYTMAKKVVRAGLPAFTLDHKEAADLHGLGIPGFNRKTVKGLLEEKGAVVAEPKPEPVLYLNLSEEPQKKSMKTKGKPVQMEMKFGKS